MKRVLIKIYVITSMTLGYLMIAPTPTLQAKEDSAAKPNVLFIMCDDLNDWVLHPDMHPQVQTPNMDRLRAKSVNFSNAHVVTPVCGPSRKILFSGLYPHTFKSYQFKAWRREKLLSNCVPIPLHFRNHGYSTYGTGKLLHEGQGGPFYTDYGIGKDFGPFAMGTDGKTTWTHPKLYAKWKNTIRYKDISYGPLSDVPVWDKDAAQTKAQKDGWFYESGKPFRYVNEADRDPMPDEISAQYAVDILDQPHDRPFFLGVGFVRPHTPLYAPKKYFDMYPLESITLPPYLEDDLEDSAEALRNRWMHSFHKFAAIKKRGVWKEWIQAYLACVTFVDDQLGIVLDALEESPYADNTIIVFTSDNGYHLGEKSAMQKWHLWEESTRVPLFIHVPKARENGRTSPHPVSTVDLYPTLADLCGLSLEPNEGESNIPLDGHSLRPFLNNPDTKQWEGPSVAFMAVGKSWDDKPGWNIGPHQSVRSDRYRYTLCSNGEEELYDHDKDPQEWTNLASNPEYSKIKAELREALLAIHSNQMDN